MTRHRSASLAGKETPTRPGSGLVGQMAKCHVWPSDRFCPGNTGFLTWPWSIWPS